MLLKLLSYLLITQIAHTNETPRAPQWLQEYNERLACKVAELCKGVYKYDNDLLKRMAETPSPQSQKIRAALQDAEINKKLFSDVFNEREKATRASQKEFEQKNGPRPSTEKLAQAYDAKLSAHVNEKLTSLKLDNATINSQMADLNAGPKMGATTDPAERVVRAIRENTFHNVVNDNVNGAGRSDLSKKMAIQSSPEIFRDHLPPKLHAGSVYKGILETGPVARRMPANPGIEDLDDYEFRQKNVNKNSGDGRPLHPTREHGFASVRAMTGMALTSFAFLVANAAASDRDLEDCVAKYKLNKDEKDLLKSISYSPGYIFNKSCDNAELSPSGLQELYEQNKLTPNIAQLVEDRLKTMKAEQLVNYEIAAEPKKLCENYKIKSYGLEIGAFVKDTSCPTCAYNVILKSGDQWLNYKIIRRGQNLEPEYTTLKCYKNENEEDKPCTVRLQSIIPNNENTTGLVQNLGGHKSFFKAFKDDPEFAKKYCQNSKGERAHVCRAGRSYAATQMAIAAVDNLCTTKVAQRQTQNQTQDPPSHMQSK